MTDPAVDVVIAVHTAARPVDRAAASVLDHTRAPVRVTVVAHNIDREIIRGRLGERADDPRLRLIDLQDGIRSPAGPMNLGLDLAEAGFTALLGSDDEFAPGAIDSWLGLAERTGADAVLAKIRLAGGAIDPYPPVRGGSRTKRLDARADRLAYRSAPLGLISRERFAGLRFAEGLASGEDLPYSLTAWFTGRRIAYDLDGPPYIVNDDSEDRVTSEARPLAEDFAFLDHLESLPWFAAADRRTRLAIVVKLMRMHLFDALLVRLGSDEQLRGNRDGFLALIERLERLAPGAMRLLSIADRRVLDALRSPRANAETLRALLAARGDYASPAALLPRNLLGALHAQAPFRTLLAGRLAMRHA